MITAAEFEENYGSSYSSITDMMEAYATMKAKYYVQEALKAAVFNAHYTTERDSYRNIKSVTINKDSILDAYPLENIK